MAANWFQAPAPVARRVRAYYAPVNRAAQTPVLFDPALQNDFDFDAPPSPWLDLGWITRFARKSTSKSAAVMTGIPAAAQDQVRETLAAEVSFDFLSWTKLTMALTTGSQHMNLLVAASGAAVAVQSGSTASSIVLAAADAANFAAGALVAVDADYTGQTGFVGTPVAGAYVRQALSDVDYIRRVTFNVAQIAAVNGTTLTLAEPLPGGTPAAGAKLQAVTGFVDREGGTYFQEWSALFAMQGAQGERVFFHYPRLQPMGGAEEVSSPLDAKNAGGLARVLLKARFLALPVTDPLDGERVVCYRSYVPEAASQILASS